MRAPAPPNTGNWRPGWRSPTTDYNRPPPVQPQSPPAQRRWNQNVDNQQLLSAEVNFPPPRIGCYVCRHWLSQPFAWFRCCVATSTPGFAMLCVWPLGMPLIPPPGWSSATDTQCPGSGTQPITETGTYCCQSTVKLAAGLDPGRASPAGISTPSVKLGVACASVETQTVPLTVERGQPVVNFLDSADCSPTNDGVPNCYPLGDNVDFVRSPWVPVTIEGVRVPMLLDSVAEVTILSYDFLNRLCPGQEFPDKGRMVRSLGGNHLSVKGPVTLKICLLYTSPSPRD